MYISYMLTKANTEIPNDPRKTLPSIGLHNCLDVISSHFTQIAPIRTPSPSICPKNPQKKYGKKQKSIENHDKNTTLVPLLLIRFHSFGHHSTAALSTGQGAEELIIEGFANAVAHLVR